jgi:cytochrome c-type biogenesis protein CcmF
VLAVAAFLLVVYATFLTRSGVLADFSVHSFVNLGITGWLVFNMLFFLAISIGLLAYRWREIPTDVGDEPFMSRTIFFVVGILLTILIGLVVLFGTSAPLISRLWGEPAQVGPDFYNRMGFWLAVAFAVVVGATPFLGWSRAREGWKRHFVVTLAATVALTGVGIGLGLQGPKAIVYVAAALFALVANVWATAEYVRAKRWQLAGGAIAHIGLGLLLLAFLTTGWLGREHKVRLAEGEPSEVLGYTMVFRGVEKPTPMARDAMVVDVTTPTGRNFVLKPKMWVNQKSNQLVANPDIKSFLTTDLYLAPVEYEPGQDSPVSGRMVLRKEQPFTFRDWTLTFKAFDLSRQNAVPGALTVGVVIELDRPDAPTATLEPSMVSTNDGVQAVAVDIPGVTGARLRATGMSVDQGMVRVEILGLGGGIGATESMTKGDSLTYRDMTVSFADFDLSEFDPDAGKIDFGVVFDVELDGRSLEVVPTFRTQPDGETVVTPAVVPGSGGMALTLGRVDAENGRIELQVFDPALAPPGPTPASLVLDVSTKPLISFVWLGTILVVVGIIMAIALRRKDLESIPMEG